MDPVVKISIADLALSFSGFMVMSKMDARLQSYIQDFVKIVGVP